MAKFNFLITGPICSGKSSLMEYIGKNTSQFDDLIKDWDEIDRQVNITLEYTDLKALALFYLKGLSARDREANSNIFELSTTIGRGVRHLLVKNSPGLNGYDQSIVSAAETYFKNSFNSGLITHEAKDIYFKIVRSIIDSLGRLEQNRWKEQLIIYMRVLDANILYKRYLERNTPGENPSLEYLESLITQNEHFTSNLDTIYPEYGLTVPKLITIDAAIDCNKNPEFHPQTLDQIIKTMKEMDIYERRNE